MSGTDVTIVGVDDVGSDTIAIEIESPTDFDALPGQFLLIRETVDSEEFTRFYTLSSPDVEGTFELTIGVDPDGDLSPHLASLDPGDTITVEGPFGDVAYASDEDAVTIASGPGIGPAVGIAEAAIDAGYDASVIYQNGDPPHVGRLADLNDRGATVEVLDADDTDSLRGAIERSRSRGQIYVFGFSPFVDTVRQAIVDAGGDPTDARIENFG